jgi:hypothetical protein
MKPICLFATPRTGSNYLINLIYHGSLEQLGYKKADEIFNTEAQIPNNPKAANLERKNRLEYIKHTPNAFFKFFPTHIDSEIFHYINETYLIIGLSRENIFEQVLSWYISDQTACWSVLDANTAAIYQAKTTYLLDNKLYFPKIRFEQMMGEFSTYFFLLSNFKNVIKTFTYEYVFSVSPVQILEDLHLDYNSIPNLPLKQNLADKLQYFCNADEIKEWAKNSYVSRVTDCSDFKARLPCWG